MFPHHTDNELYEIAKAQKIILWAILASLVFLIPAIRPLRILVWLFQAWAVYRLARALRVAVPWLWGVATLVPLLGLILLLVLNGKATRALQAAGVRVGLLGAGAADLRRLKGE